MKAVQNFVNKNHDSLIKFGGLFFMLLLIVVIPAHTEYTLRKQINAHLENEQNLRATVAELNHQMDFYKTAYSKQQAIQQEVQCLAKNIYFEAATEPRAGKIAVAEVTMNRVKHGYASTVCGVVNQKNKGICQFSWVCEPRKKITMISQWNEAKEIAENILISKKKYSTIQGAVFFHADYVSPSWAETKDFIKQVGRHLFYKD